MRDAAAEHRGAGTRNGGGSQGRAHERAAGKGIISITVNDTANTIFTRTRSPEATRIPHIEKTQSKSHSESAISCDSQCDRECDFESAKYCDFEVQKTCRNSARTCAAASANLHPKRTIRSAEKPCAEKCDRKKLGACVDGVRRKVKADAHSESAFRTAECECAEEKVSAPTSARCECGSRSSVVNREKTPGDGGTQIALVNARFDEKSAICKKNAHQIALNGIVRQDVRSATARRGAPRARVRRRVRVRRGVRVRQRQS